MSGTPPRREQTDESLRSEREKTDAELQKKRTAAEEESDSVIEHAQDRADEVLRVARAKADDASSGSTASIEGERRVQDRLLADERETAATQLATEREDLRRALRDLLRFERDETDKDLLLERIGADQALSSRDTFLGMVAHDLRTLLGGVALNAALLLRETSADERGQRVARRAESIQRETARMNRLIGDLLDVVSIEAGRLRIAREPNDVHQLLRIAAHAVELQAARKHVTVTFPTAQAPLIAECDHDRILQVVANLLSNAIKFSQPDGRVEVLADAEGDQVVVSVVDDGTGVPSDQLEAIFERYHQVDHLDRRGHGLGLYISKSIVEAHGGRIWAESAGRGAAFRFTLPIARAS